MCSSDLAHQSELAARLLALLGEFHQRTESGGIDEIDSAEIDQQGRRGGWNLAANELAELLVGIGVELAGEAEQQSLGQALATTPQGHRQSLQIVDRSNPPGGLRRKCSERNRKCDNRNETWAEAQRRWAISSTKRAKW